MTRRPKRYQLVKTVRLYKYQIVEIRPKEYIFDLTRSVDTSKIKDMSQERLLKMCQLSFNTMYSLLNKVVKSAEIVKNELKVTIE